MIPRNALVGDTNATPNLAVYCDFENVAIGAREAGYGEFDIQLTIQRLLDKGSIIVKKAYADWERFRGARRSLHEAGFELIEIPHISASGKNSADIRLVVDAIDLCYTKAHVDVFVVISGDSDFSPLVAKLRENNKLVLGLGVKKSTSGLLVDGCDEFIYYDDLVREQRVEQNKKKRQARRSSGDDHERHMEERQGEAMDLVVDVVDALLRDRETPLFGSMVKQTLKRKRPNFSESFHGYRNFSQLLEDARERGLLQLDAAPSGGYMVLGLGSAAGE
ncbi:MAG: NYN domain-containing protein [Myxococcota bacterium]